MFKEKQQLVEAPQTSTEKQLILAFNDLQEQFRAVQKYLDITIVKNSAYSVERSSLQGVQAYTPTQKSISLAKHTGK